MEPVTWMLTGMEKHSDEYRSDLLGNNTEALKKCHEPSYERVCGESLYVAMNELSSKPRSFQISDLDKSQSRTDSHARPPEKIQVLWDFPGSRHAADDMAVGAPTIYYGDGVPECVAGPIR